MTKTTPNYSIPYPDAGDPIYKGHEQMRDLALTVDRTMKTVNGVQGPAGPQGPQGVKGDAGPAGTGFTLLGMVLTSSELPSNAAAGDAYLAEDTRDVHVWSGTEWANVGQIQGPQGAKGDTGPAGPQGPAGVDTPVTNWTTSGITLRDNGTIRLGTGGTFEYRWRVDRGQCQVYFRIRFGSNATSAGGAVRMTVPVTPSAGIEGVGSGMYFCSAQSWFMPLIVSVPIDEPGHIYLRVPKSGGDTTNGTFQIWNGSNGAGTGIPLNPGFRLDANGSVLAGSIQFPV